MAKGLLSNNEDIVGLITGSNYRCALIITRTSCQSVFGVFGGEEKKTVSSTANTFHNILKVLLNPANARQLLSRSAI